MKKQLGVWIDHREAVLVTLAGEDAAIERISADGEQHGRFSANSPEGAPEDRRDRRIEQHLHQYYTEVVAVLREADSILILGPGEAKGELKKLLEHENLSSRIVDVEAADKLTDPQIVAKVRHYFLK